MTAEIHKKPGEDKDTSARGGKRGKVMMDEERERERKSGRTAQSLRSKGGRDGENSDKNKGSLSLYLAASTVALVSGGGGGGGSSSIIRARSTFFLLTRGRHGDKRSVQRRGCYGRKYLNLPSIAAPFWRVGVDLQSDLVSGPNQDIVHSELPRHDDTRGDDPGDC